MTKAVFAVAALVLASLLADQRAWPRPTGRIAVRSAAGSWLLALVMLGIFGVWLAIGGDIVVAALLSLALLGLVILVSNTKAGLLGEPLLFSDLALLKSVFRHPQFYLSAVRPALRISGLVAGLALLALLVTLYQPAPAPHLAGLATALAALAALAATLQLAPGAPRAMQPAADLQADGVAAMLLRHWWQWRRTADPPPCPPLAAVDAAAASLVVIVQCESFADPADMLADPSLALPGLGAARHQAWQWGNLHVSGFGANTMRTEYGVLFGRSEAALGFRRFDPYLTAAGEATHALPARLRPIGWHSSFIHPHDLRFYNRDRIMPAAGFTTLVGGADFAPPAPGTGRYVADADVAARIAVLARAVTGPALLYAVTMENHGPWPALPNAGLMERAAGYLRLVRRSDAMLSTLMADIAALRRPAILLFFGDHRPSIPGVTAPGGAIHTPYVMVRFDAAGEPIRGDGQACDRTPAALHHDLIGLLTGPC